MKIPSLRKPSMFRAGLGLGTCILISSLVAEWLRIPFWIGLVASCVVGLLWPREL